MFNTSRRRVLRNPAELLIVNPHSSRSHKRLIKKKKAVRKNPVKKKKVSNMAGLVKRRKVTKRRAVKSNPKRKSAKRVAAGKKAARTRKRRALKSNPARKSTARKRVKRRATRKVRRNPWPKGKKVSPKLRAKRTLARYGVALPASATVTEMQSAIASAKSQGRKAKGGRRKAAGAKRSGRKPGPKKGSKRKSTAVARRSHKRGRKPANRALTRTIRSSTKKRGTRKKYTGMQTARRVRRSALSMKKRAANLPKKTRDYMVAHGIHRVNPSLKEVGRAVVALLPEVGMGVLAMAGALWGGSKIGEALAKPGADGQSLQMKMGKVGEYAAPITTGVVTLGLFTLCRMVAKGKFARFSAPLLVGGLSAAAIQVAFKVRVGADQATIASKLSLDKLLGEYTSVGSIFDRQNAISEYTSVGEYEHMDGMDDDVQWADGEGLSGADDVSPFAPGEGGILAGRMF